MGNAVYCMPRRDDSACSERYADDMPLSLPYRQLPPTSEPASKQSNGMPRACRTWHAAIPVDPAPMTHARTMAAALADADRGGGRLGSVIDGPAVRRRPPVPAAEERYRRRDEQGPHEEGVHEDADRERGEDALVNGASRLSPHHQREDAEGAGQDEPGRGDRQAGVLQGPGHRLPQRHPARLLPDPGHDEDVVVLAEGQQEHEHEERDEVVQPAGAGQVLEEQHGHAERGQVAEGHGGDEVERGYEAAQDQREQEPDDDDRDREDAHQVLGGGLAHVVYFFNDTATT